MKILSIPQQREADAYTISHEPIKSIDLMERAARSCYTWFHQNISRQKQIAVVCGKGNNGGDGLALARMLLFSGYRVRVYVLEHSEKSSADFSENLGRWVAANQDAHLIKTATKLVEEEADVWVDALFGSGLNAPLAGLAAEVVGLLNAKKGMRVAIDIPSGLFADDNTGNSFEGILKADVTLTFQSPKFSFLFPAFGQFAGKVVVLNIGLSVDYLAAVQTKNYFLQREDVLGYLPTRSKFNHKNSFGHAYVVAGCFGKMGAAVLASKAALRSGCGLVTAVVPQCGVTILQTSAPEVMVLADEGVENHTTIPPLLGATAIGIGPGIGQHPQTADALHKFLSTCQNPVVLDADALNILATTGNWHVVPDNSILTPHLGELKRMLGHSLEGEEVFEAASNFAETHRFVLLVKGAHSAVYTPGGEVYFNSTGNAGMATAGSGDVLTGIITGLLAQGLTPVQAACAGMLFHGMAGDAAVEALGQRALIASDILENLRLQHGR